VKLLHPAAPPSERITSAWRRIIGSSAACPASLSAKYAFTEALSSAGPPG
jgi:hypothetical protein